MIAAECVSLGGGAGGGGGGAASLLCCHSPTSAASQVKHVAPTTWTYSIFQDSNLAWLACKARANYGLSKHPSLGLVI